MDTLTVRVMGFANTWKSFIVVSGFGYDSAFNRVARSLSDGGLLVCFHGMLL